MMSRITGTGCMLSGLATAYAVANRDNITEAVAASVCLMGYAGEIGVSNMKDGEGNSSLRNHIIDAIYNMDAEKLTKGAKYEVR
jgi:hydroxyethylthiazole kinase